MTGADRSSAAAVDFAMLQPGDPLPPITVNPSYMDLVIYAGTSRDYFEIHHDRDAARAAGHPDVIVQGSLKAAWLSRVVTSPLGEHGILREFAVQYRGVDIPDRPVVAKGTVRSVEETAGAAAEPATPERLLTIDLWLENASGERTVTGMAVVAIPAR